MKKRNVFYIAITAGSIFLATGCSDKKVEIVQGNAPMTQEQPDFSKRPEWTMIEPGVEDGMMSFVGLSGLNASESNARDDARSNAVNAAVIYLGTLAKSKYERAAVSFGLSSQVMDPTESTRKFQRQVAANVANRMKVERWYPEVGTDATGKRGIQVFALAKIPTEELDKAFQQTAKDNMEDAKKRAREAATQQAKKQAQDAADFWQEMTKQGVTD